MPMSVEHWDPQTEGELSEASLRRKLLDREFNVGRYVYPPGTRFPGMPATSTRSTPW